MSVWDNLPNVMAAIGALGTAAYGLVDASKAFKGGVSNVGLGFLQRALVPFEPALQVANPDDPLETVRANWLNGVDPATQKATVKSLVHLGLTNATGPRLVATMPEIDGAVLAAIVNKMSTGMALAPAEVDVLGRFDAILDARLDACFERADQLYRNTAKVCAGLVAIILAVIGAGVAHYTASGTATADNYWTSGDLLGAILIGLIATPLAPVAKDLTSAISTAVSAIKSTKS